MRVLVLGPSRVEDDAAVDARLPRKPRALLAALALHLDTHVSADALVDLVWGDRPPAGAHGTLHSYVSDLRRALEPDRGSRGRPEVLLTAASGYRLHLDRSAVDAAWFTDEVGACHRVLAPLTSQLSTGRGPGWPDRETVSAHLDRLEAALGSWTGAAYADLPDHPDVLAGRAALDELRLTAEEDRVLALLALGEQATVVAATEQATSRHPLRERTWALHTLALVRSHRQADALAALRTVRGLLADELGLDPGQELQDLERAVLVQDPRLREWLPAVGAPHSAAAATGAAARIPVASPSGAQPPWATVGRGRERSALQALLEEVRAGRAGHAVLVGEPGVGKSRLVDAVVEHATGSGFAVAVGRCSQDDGAPPLWPWRAVTAVLSGDGGTAHLPDVGPGAGGAVAEESRAFHAWEELAARIRDTAAARPVLLVFEDLHWADEATLRALSHLVSTTDGGARLALLVTRRPWPVPSGALGELDELLARRHARVLELAGLARDEAARLVEGVCGHGIEPSVVQDWHERSGGNPFFLVELARLGDQRSSPRSGGPVPTTVSQVVLRRVDQLPEATRDLLRLAAALGRELSLDVLAAVAGEDPERVDEQLQDARAAGLVRDREPGRLAFEHALTRDAVAAAIPATRLARLHARIAHALEHDAAVAAVVRPEERVAELARHWLAAGPTHVGRAWRAAAVAAAQARGSFAHQEAADLMQAAVEAHRRDPAGSREERYDLLMARTADAQRAADWTTVVACAVEAIELGRMADDPVRVASAAAEVTRNAIWSVHQWQQVLPDVVEDLRWALKSVGDHDGPDRCRLMLALAVELYYAPGAASEVEALVDEGVAMARRLGDPELLWWSGRAGFLALWSPRHAVRRAELSEQALTAAEEMGDETALAVALAGLAAVRLELGDLAAYTRLAGRANGIARRRRLTYVRLSVGWVDLTLAAMRGDTATVTRLTEDLAEVRNWVETPTADFMRVAVALSGAVWSEEIGQHAATMLSIMEGVPVTELGHDALFMALARAGALDDLRRIAATPLPIEADSWRSSMAAACLAEAAAALGDATEAARARELLRPLVGRMVVSGISLALGPVDGYLALAEATAGDPVAAAQHADRAAELADEWGLPQYRRWLDGHRARLGI